MPTSLSMLENLERKLQAPSLLHSCGILTRCAHSITEISETRFMVSRPRPSRPMGWSRHRDRDQDSNFQSLETETHWDQGICKLLRPRLVETGLFSSCWDRDSSRLDENCRDRDFDETFQGILVKLCNSYFDIKKLNNEATLWLIYYMDGCILCVEG